MPDAIASPGHASMNDAGAAGKIDDAGLLSAVQGIRDGYVTDTGGRRSDGLPTKAMRHHGAPTPRSVVDLEQRMAAWVASTVLEYPSLSIKSSAGQKGRRYTLIPYVMVLRDDVTTSPTRGVYLALLFDENCSSLWVSLNQGIAQFENCFEGLEILEAVELVASATADGLAAPPDFAPGRISLSARMRYGKAYERGAILSRKFDLTAIDLNFAQELRTVLRQIVDVYVMMPSDVAADLAGTSDNRARLREAHFQEEVLQLAAKLPPTAFVPDVRVVPASKKRSISNLYARDPTVAAAAIVAAAHACEADCGNRLFKAASSGRHYVEAHHVIPLHHQHRYPEASLDVPANVVALCPMCHARIHRGAAGEKRPLLETLFAKRQNRLKSVGLHCTLEGLVRAYADRRHISDSVANDVEIKFVTCP